MKKLIRNLFILFVGFLIFLTGQTVAETIEIRKEINSFIKKGEFQEDISIEGEIEFYKVSRETYYSQEFARTPFFNDDLERPGSEGDLFVTREAPIPHLPGFYEFMTFYFGGHAAYVGPDNELYETYGFPDYDENILKVIFKGGRDTHVDIADNYFLEKSYRNEFDPNYEKYNGYYRNEWFGLRLKGITQDEIDQTTAFMNHLVDVKAQYNHLYIFNTKYKYYCTDMMSRAFAIITNSNNKSKYNLNRDGVAVTVNDLILSKDTYIAYYVYTDRNNVKKVYYIG